MSLANIQADTCLLSSWSTGRSDKAVLGGTSDRENLRGGEVRCPSSCWQLLGGVCVLEGVRAWGLAPWVHLCLDKNYRERES